MHTKRVKEISTNSPLKTDEKDPRVIADIVRLGHALSVVVLKGDAAYLRRLTNDEQAREGISLENQRDKISAYCSLNDMTLLDTIHDDGISAKNLNREGMQTLISTVKHGKVDAVIVYKLDRLSRSVKDTISLIELFEKQQDSLSLN